MLEQFFSYLVCACARVSFSPEEYPSILISRESAQASATHANEADIYAPAHSPVSLAIAGALLAVFALVIIGNIRDYSPTYDEMKFLRIGQELSSGAGWRTEMSVVHAPLSFHTHGFLLKPFQFTDEMQRLRWARATMLVYALALGALIYLWATELFGAKGGILALALFVFNSNILGHSSLITTDIVYACFSLFLLFFFWKSLTDGKIRWIIAAGISLGLALLAKYSAVLWFFLLPSLGALCFAARFLRRKKMGTAPSIGPAKCAVVLFAIFVLAVLVLNIGYGFTGSFSPLGAHDYQSAQLSKLSHNSLFSKIPVPAPYPFLRGYDAQKHISEVGHPSFLAGMRSANGWWYYYPLAFLLKMPLAFWPLMILTVPALLRKAGERRRMAQLLLVFSSFALIAAHSFLSRSQAGFRYILVALPPLFILTGALPQFLATGWRKMATAGLLIFYIVPALWVHPHHIAYFSEIVGGPKNGYKWLSDSNLEWGQDAAKASQYLRSSHVPVSVNPGFLPVPGVILISATTLQDCFSLHDIHGWLRQFKPSGHIGYSWLIFDIDEERVSARPDKRNLPDEFYFAAFEYSRDHLRNAQQLAQTALQSHPQLPEALYLLGLTQMGLEKLDEAAASFAAVPQSHPLYVDARGNLAVLSALKGDGESLREFQRQSMAGEICHSYADKPALTADPPADMAPYKIHNNRGVFYWTQGDLASAEREIRSALEAKPDFFEGLANLAVVLEERGAFAEALEVTQQYDAGFLLLEHSPYRDYRVYYEGSRVMLGDALEIYPKPDADILRLKSSLSLRPNDPVAVNQLAILLMKQGRFGEAHETIQKGLAAESESSGALYNNLAVLYTEKKMFSRALEACRQSLEMNPENPMTVELRDVLREKVTASGLVE